MIDRQSEKPGRVKFTLDDGTVMYGVIERADFPIVIGTPISRATLFNSNNSARYGCDLPSEAFEAIAREVIVEVPSSAWSAEQDEEGYFTATINVDGMKEEYSPVFAPYVTDSISSADLEADFSLIKRMSTYDGYVVFKAIEAPMGTVGVRIKGV